jgi:hypothetical protein
MKYTNKVKSVSGLMELFADMNGGKGFPESEVTNNFNTRNFVYADGTKVNLWTLMVENGFYVKLPF